MVHPPPEGGKDGGKHQIIATSFAQQDKSAPDYLKDPRC
jgi:hypothetical protein